MSAWTYDWATIDVLWRRDVLRFLRQPTRILGALGQPLVFWLILGLGLSASFHIPGVDMDYIEFFFPGVMAMIVLFASIFSSVSVIEDRRQGFLQTVLAGPGSRAALVLGKCLGSATVALFQAALFFVLAPLAGFAWSPIDIVMVCLTLVLTALGLTAVGFAVAWMLDSVQGYHAVQMLLLIPLWVVSGAVFPPGGAPVVIVGAMLANPLAYAVSALRHGLYGGQAPESVVLSTEPWLEVAVVGAFAVFALTLATVVCERRR